MRINRFTVQTIGAVHNQSWSESAPPEIHSFVLVIVLLFQPGLALLITMSQDKYTGFLLIRAATRYRASSQFQTCEKFLNDFFDCIEKKVRGGYVILNFELPTVPSEGTQTIPSLSRRSRRRTLPVVVFGKSSRNSSSRGYSYLARFCFTCCLSSSRND